jgi:hypothetical protein
MSCCCRQSNDYSSNNSDDIKSIKTVRRGNPPNRVSTNRIGGSNDSNTGNRLGSSNNKMDDDRAAVNWWRSQQQLPSVLVAISSFGVNNDDKDAEVDAEENANENISHNNTTRLDPTSYITLPPVHESQFSSPSHSLTAKSSPKNLQKSKMRIIESDSWNSMEKHYDISQRESPTMSQNGIVLHPNRLIPKDSRNDMDVAVIPSSSGFVQTGVRSSFDDDDTSRMEVFQPQVELSQSLRQTQTQQPKPQKQNRQITPPSWTKELTTKPNDVGREGENSPVEQVVFNIAVVETKSDQQSPSPSSSVLKKNQEESNDPVPTMSTPTRTSSSKRNNFTHGGTNNKEKLSLSKFIEMKSKGKKTTDPSDHLSDVPSDIDSTTRDRYLLACNMLKTTIIKKESALIPIEKKFIMGLLDDFELDANNDDSIISEDQVSAVERTILRLDNDPIFQSTQTEKYTNEENNNTVLPSPTTAARDHIIQKIDDNFQSPPAVALPMRSDKNPHTATRKPNNKCMGYLSKPFYRGGPAKSEDKGINSSDEEILVVDNDVTFGNVQDASDRESGDCSLNDRFDSRDQLVRFDGWSFQNKIEFPFLILGADGNDLNPRVVTPAMMEALRSFMPYKLSESNFWLKFSLVRDGASLETLLTTIRASTYTLIGVETNHGEVFGSFTGTPWRIGSQWYGTGEAFLWRLKKRRYTSPKNSKKSNFEREIEVYPYTEDDDLVQYCTSKTIAVGGGDWQHNKNPCPYEDSEKGIGFMIDGDLAGGETNSCATFSNPKLAKHTTASSEFVISNMEVWTLTPCINTEDAIKMELHKLFIEEHGIM